MRSRCGVLQDRREAIELEGAAIQLHQIERVDAPLAPRASNHPSGAIPMCIAGAHARLMVDEPRFPTGSQRIRVLVVDDEEDLLSTLSRMLRRDADVTTARSGEEVLAELDAGDFDAVLCDMSLSGQTGREVWDAIRREAPALAERVVFMSGGAITADDQTFLESVAERLVLKPFDRDQLVAALRRYARR